MPLFEYVRIIRSLYTAKNVRRLFRGVLQGGFVDIAIRDPFYYPGLIFGIANRH